LGPVLRRPMDDRLVSAISPNFKNREPALIPQSS